MNGTHGVTRRPRAERYFITNHGLHPPEWMESVLGMLEVVLDFSGNISLQDVADALDYGPDALSPRQQETAKEIGAAWDRTVAAQQEQCKLGNHRFRDGRCWHCPARPLNVVDD